MADSLSYTTVPGKIPVLLRKIHDVSMPQNADNAWLQTIGLKSSNDRRLLNVLKKIGFIDASGVPQPAWKQYRGKDDRAVLGRAIQAGYQELYATYPNAHDRNNDELYHVFSTTSNANKETIGRMISTFRYLVQEADFTEVALNEHGKDNSPQQRGSVMPSQSQDEATPNPMNKIPPNGITININVALALPETTEPKVFEALFEAMKKHLIDNNLS